MKQGWGFGETLLFIVIDLAIYAVLVYLFGMEWIIAFFLSTAMTIGLWYIYYFFTWKG